MIYRIIGILGLALIIAGTFLISEGKRVSRKNIYPFLLAGGVLLAIYSFYIKDIIFIILQIAYILIVIYDIAQLKRGKR